MRLLLLVLAGCAHALPLGINDPRSATAFYCSVSETAPETNFCVTDEEACVSAVKIAARDGAFMSPCQGRNTAWCGVSTLPDGKPLFSCGPTRDDCGYRQDFDERIHRTRDSGECIERAAGR